MPLLRRLLGMEGRGFDTGGGVPVSSTLDPHIQRSTASGRTLTEDEAMATSAVYASVRILSEAIAGLPVDLVRKEGRRRQSVDEHPVARLVGERPNSEMDAGELWRFVMVYALFSGDGFVWVERNGAGSPTALWPIPSGQVRPYRSLRTRELFYDVTLGEEEAGPGHDRWFTVRASDMLHVKAFGTHRLRGQSPLEAARESIGTARSAQDYASRFYARDASPGGVLEVPDSLTDEEFSDLERGWRRSHEGLRRSHAVAILTGGAQWKPVGISPQDAEFIATRKFETSEIARIFGVPPHLIGDVERSTSWGTGIEQQNIGFVQYSLMPWIRRLELAATRQLLRQAPHNNPRLQLVWRPDALLRGDQKARYDAYAVGRQWGWMSANDVRELEDLPPADGGDVYLEPENMRPTVADDGDPREMRRRVEVASSLWQAGFDAGEAASWAGVPVEHLGVLPTSVYVGEDAGEPADEPDLRSSVEVREVDARARAERAAATLAAVRSVFGEQREELAEQLAGRSPLRIGDVWPKQRYDERLASVLRAVGVETARLFGGALVDGYDPEEHVSGWIARHARITAENVNAGTVERIDGLLSDGDPAGDALTRVFDELDGSRGEQLAESETTTCGQRAQQDAAERSGRRQKTWRTSSGNPRDTHAALDGETVAVGEAFSNGALYPGDPSLDESERIGCRCDMEFS